MFLLNTENVPERLLEKLFTLHDLQQQVVYAIKFIAEESSDLDAVEELLDEYIDIAIKFAKKATSDERNFILAVKQINEQLKKN